MSECTEGEAVVLEAAKLLSYEIVHSQDDLYVSINGVCLPSMCDGYTIDNNGCFVLSQGFDEFVLAPIPEHLSGVISEADELIFVHFRPDGTVDANSLPRRALPVVH